MLKLSRLSYYFFNGRAALKKQCGHLICIEQIVYTIGLEVNSKAADSIASASFIGSARKTRKRVLSEVSTNYSLSHVHLQRV